MKKRLLLVAGVVFAIIAILVIVLVSASLRKLETHEIGLKYNTIERILDTKEYFEGLYLGSPWFKFLKFSAIFRSMQWTGFTCLNKDEVDIVLTISLQYRIRTENIYDVAIFFKDERGHDVVLNAIAESSFLQACSLFNTSEFQTDRGPFQEKLRTLLSKRFENLYTDVSDLQLQNIERPSSYETVVHDKETAREDIDVARQENPKKITIAKEELKIAETDATKILQKAQSSARTLLTSADYKARAIKQQYKQEADAFLLLKVALNLTEEHFIQYMATRAIFSPGKDKFDLAIDPPIA